MKAVGQQFMFVGYAWLFIEFLDTDLRTNLSAPRKNVGVRTIRPRTIHPQKKIMLFDQTNLT
jgi:hypothetical protein